MSPTSFAVAAVPILIIIVVIVIVVRMVLRTQKKSSLVLTDLADSLGAVKSGRVYAGMRDNVPFNFTYFPGAKNSPPRLTFRVDCASEGKFKVARETAFDRWGKRWGITREIQTGDATFDQSYFLQSDTPAFAASFFGDARKRDAVQAVFQMGASEVSHDGKTMSAAWVGLKVNADTNARPYGAVLPHLMGLTRELPYPGFGIGMAAEGSSWRVNRVLAFVLAILAGAAGGLLLIHGYNTYEPLDPFGVFLDSLKYSLVAYLLFAYGALMLLRGRSSSHRELMGVWVLGLFCFLLAGVGGEITLNGRLDDAAPMVHRTPVIKKYTTKNKNTVTHHVNVQSWRPGETDESLKVDRYTYDRITPGKTVATITTRPGKFGFEWIAGQEYR